MKVLLIPLSVVVFSACSVTQPAIQLTLGAPVHHKTIAGLVVFPARLANHSQRSIWYSANIMPDMPYYRAFMRPSKSERWAELPYGMCHVGATEYEVPAGASMAFEPIAPANEAGRQYRVELSVTKARDGHTKPIQLRSEPAVIQ